MTFHWSTENQLDDTIWAAEAFGFLIKRLVEINLIAEYCSSQGL